MWSEREEHIEMTEFLRNNDIENTTYHDIRNTFKAGIKGKFTTLNNLLKGKE